MLQSMGLQRAEHNWQLNNHRNVFSGEMSRSFVHCLIGLFAFLKLSCINCLYIWGINPLSVDSFAIIFSHSEGCLFILLMVSFAVPKLLSLIGPICFFVFFHFHYSRRWVIEDLVAIYVKECSIYNFL